MKRAKELKQIQTWDAADICIECKGACCKEAPGESRPEDFFLDGSIHWPTVREALESGDWCADYWVGDPESEDDTDIGHSSFYLRPNSKGENSLVARSLAMSYECKFLTDNGCVATIKPFGCRTLKPVPDLGCHHELPEGIWNSKHVSAILWKPYSEQLYKLANEVWDSQD